MTAMLRGDDGIVESKVDTTAAAPTGAPSLEKTEAAIESRRTRSIDLNVLAVLAVLYTLYLARDFLLPIDYAILLKFLLSQVVRWLGRMRIKPPIGAALIILAIFATLGSGAFKLSTSVRDWAVTAPATLVAAEQKLGKYIKPLQRASKTAEQVANAAGAAAGATPATTKTAEVVVQGPSLASRAFGTGQRSIATILEVLILLYFLLAAGDLFLQKLVKVLPNLGDKMKAVSIARAIEGSISTYLFTATSVNVVEGVVVAGVMYLWKMPNPAVWGSLVAILEFIPYLGALAMVVILAVAALTTFDSIGKTLLIPASFLAINLIQGNLVSPVLLGHRLSLNPVALFIGLAFWFWIWGVAGAFIAVPLLAMLKIFCDHIESLAAVGEFLGQRDDGERRSTLRATTSSG
jgi:predicted PurR-regulated permease PerM